MDFGPYHVPGGGDRKREIFTYGAAVGDVVRLEPAPGRRVTWRYVRDPEGNVIELQSWGESAVPD